jgi:hypothetical protein
MIGIVLIDFMSSLNGFVHSYVDRINSMPFHQLLHRAVELFTTQVLLLWLFSLAFIVAAGLLLSNHRLPMFPSRPDGDRRYSLTKLSRGLNPTDVTSVIVFLIFLAFYIILIFYKEDFAYYDDDILTDFSVRGMNFLPPVWSAVGRFYPLADQEFNLLKFITRSPAGYHALEALQLIVLVAVLFVVLRAFQVRYRVLILIAAMVAPSFLIPFTGFVYPERNVLFWLAMMLLCLQEYSRTNARIYFMGCLVATHLALYYKETVVLFVVAYATTQLLLQFAATRRGGQISWLKFANENILSFGMLGVSAIYLMFFLVAMFPQRNFSYIKGLREPIVSVLLAYLQIDWLPLILLVVLVLRFGLFLFSNGQLDPMWDPLAVAALAYFFGVVSLRINSGYYMAPVDLFALLYLANMLLLWLSKASGLRIAVVAVVFSVVLLHDIAYSSFRMVERKGLITTKSQFADFLNGYLSAAKSRNVELFFPYSDGYRLMGLSSYLKYKGFPLQGQHVAGSENSPRLVIASRKNFNDSRCVNYRGYTCIHAESADPGALIVILPDDNVSMSDVQRVAADSDLVFSANGCAACTKQDSWFRWLHAISAEFSVKPLPKHWLQLDVYQSRP